MPQGYWDSYQFLRGVRHRFLSGTDSTCLSSCQSDMRPLEMRQGTRAFSMVSTGDPDNPSSCQMKDDPAFKSMHGNPALFTIRSSRCKFHLRQQTQGSSHIPLAERRLLLRCLWKVGIPLELKPGNQLSSRDVFVYTELSSSCSAEICVPLYLGISSRGISGVA